MANYVNSFLANSHDIGGSIGWNGFKGDDAPLPLDKRNERRGIDNIDARSR